MKEQLIMKSIFGSHLYGLSTPESDTDYKGIYIPDSRQLVLQTASKQYQESTASDKTKNTKDDIDIEMFSLHEFVRLASKGETVAIDMLHTPDNMLITNSDEWQFLRNNRHRFYTTNMVAYIGYVRKQAAKYGVKGTRLDAIANTLKYTRNVLSEYSNDELDKVKLSDIAEFLPIDKFCKFVEEEKNNITHEYYQVLEKKFQMSLRVKEFISILVKIYDSYGERAKQAMQNEGIDWKAVSHAIRAGEQLKEIYQTGDLIYPLKKRYFILKVKLGHLDFMTEVKPYLETLVQDVELLAEELESTGKLNSTVDIKFWEDFVYNVYRSHILK